MWFDWQQRNEQHGPLIEPLRPRNKQARLLRRRSRRLTAPTFRYSWIGPAAHDEVIDVLRSGEWSPDDHLTFICDLITRRESDRRCLNVRHATSSALESVKLGQVVKSGRYSSEPHDLSTARAMRLIRRVFIWAFVAHGQSSPWTAMPRTLTQWPLGTRFRRRKLAGLGQTFVSIRHAPFWQVDVARPEMAQAGLQRYGERINSQKCFWRLRYFGLPKINLSATA